jgi:hypothetical protein
VYKINDAGRELIRQVFEYNHIAANSAIGSKWLEQMCDYAEEQLNRTGRAALHIPKHLSMTGEEVNLALVAEEHAAAADSLRDRIYKAATEAMYWLGMFLQCAVTAILILVVVYLIVCAVYPEAYIGPADAARTSHTVRQVRI